MRLNDLVTSGTFSAIMILVYFLFIWGMILGYIAISHSIKRRIVSGQDFSAGSVFAWTLGWGLASAYSLGIATIIYYFVKRRQINETKAQCSQLLANTRRALQYQQQPISQSSQFNQQPAPPAPYQQPQQADQYQQRPPAQ